MLTINYIPISINSIEEYVDAYYDGHLFKTLQLPPNTSKEEIFEYVKKKYRKRKYYTLYGLMISIGFGCDKNQSLAIKILKNRKIT